MNMQARIDLETAEDAPANYGAGLNLNTYLSMTDRQGLSFASRSAADSWGQTSRIRFIFAILTTCGRFLPRSAIVKRLKSGIEPPPDFEGIGSHLEVGLPAEVPSPEEL
jgi:hypothetical protein